MSKLLNSFLGPFGQLIGIPDLRVSENSRCIVTFNGSIDVAISTSDKDNYLQIESSIFEDIEPIDRDILILMLGVNHNAQLVSDSMMALDEQRGSIVLLRRERIHLLEYPTFLTMMEEFPKEVRVWRSRFNQILEKTIRNELERGTNFDAGSELTVFRA